jgi:hypothetical protein
LNWAILELLKHHLQSQLLVAAFGIVIVPYGVLLAGHFQEYVIIYLVNMSKDSLNFFVIISGKLELPHALPLD